jgi:hypothetical protein
MFRKSPEVKRQEALYKILHNGFQYLVMDKEQKTILSQHRYEWQAVDKKRWGEKVIPIKKLLNLI